MNRPGENKPRFNLISYAALGEIAKVASMGAAKHGENDWRTGGNDHSPLTTSQAFDAMMRHIAHLTEGKTLVDHESGLLIAAHIAWNAMAIIEIQLLRPEFDDLKEVVK